MLPERVQCLVRLLDSPNDGEALAACRALSRALRKENMDFHDLAKGVVVREVVRYVDRVQPGPPPPPPETGRKELKELIARGEACYREAEWNFLMNLNHWRGDFTAKQQGWLDDIKRRAKAAG